MIIELSLYRHHVQKLEDYIKFCDGKKDIEDLANNFTTMTYVPIVVTYSFLSELNPNDEFIKTRVKELQQFYKISEIRK